MRFAITLSMVLALAGGCRSSQQRSSHSLHPAVWVGIGLVFVGVAAFAVTARTPDECHDVPTGCLSPER